MVGCVKQTLSSFQKKLDYKPENPGVAQCTQVLLHVIVFQILVYCRYTASGIIGACIPQVILHGSDITGILQVILQIYCKWYTISDITGILQVYCK